MTSKDMFRSKYEELKERADAAKSKRSTLQTDHYEDSTKCDLCNKRLVAEMPKDNKLGYARGCPKAKSTTFWRAQTDGQVPFEALRAWCEEIELEGLRTWNFLLTTSSPLACSQRSS